MSASNFLKEKIQQMAFIFPFGKYSYEYDKFSGMHIIQVEPLSLYNFNEKYKDFETSLSINFDDTYYPESVLFLSDESLNKVTNPDFEVTGYLFGQSPIITKIISRSFVSCEIFSSDAGVNNYALAA